MEIQSLRSSSGSSSLESKIEHRHNDYSCYIQVVNKTEVELHLVDSKAVSGSWANGSAPRTIKPNSVALIELTDPKGPRGSEGWCKYRLHHPERSNSITFKLKFSDPYWPRDENYLQAFTSYPNWISLNVLKYRSSGHPFKAYVEVSTSNNSTLTHRPGHKSVDSAISLSPAHSERDKVPVTGTSSEVFPEVETGSNASTVSSRDRTGDSQLNNSRVGSSYSTHSKKESAVVLIYEDEDKLKDKATTLSVNESEEKKNVEVSVEEIMNDLAETVKADELQKVKEEVKQAEEQKSVTVEEPFHTDEQTEGPTEATLPTQKQQEQVAQLEPVHVKEHMQAVESSPKLSDEQPVKQPTHLSTERQEGFIQTVEPVRQPAMTHEPVTTTVSIVQKTSDEEPKGELANSNELSTIKASEDSLEEDQINRPVEVIQPVVEPVAMAVEEQSEHQIEDVTGMEEPAHGLSEPREPTEMLVQVAAEESTKKQVEETKIAEEPPIMAVPTSSSGGKRSETTREAESMPKQSTIQESVAELAFIPSEIPIKEPVKEPVSREQPVQTLLEGSTEKQQEKSAQTIDPVQERARIPEQTVLSAEKPAQEAMMTLESVESDEQAEEEATVEEPAQGEVKEPIPVREITKLDQPQQKMIEASETESADDNRDPIRVTEDKCGETTGLDSRAVAPKTEPSHWAMLTSHHTKIGAIAFVFLASYGYTFARISGALMFGMARYSRRS